MACNRIFQIILHFFRVDPTQLLYSVVAVRSLARATSSFSKEKSSLAIWIKEALEIAILWDQLQRLRRLRPELRNCLWIGMQIQAGAMQLTFANKDCGEKLSLMIIFLVISIMESLHLHRIKKMKFGRC